MLSLSGFELYSHWVPLMNVGPIEKKGSFLCDKISRDLIC